MKSHPWILLCFVLLMCMSSAAQNMIVYFDDDVIVEDMRATDSVAEETIVVDSASVDTVVADSTMIDSLAIVDSAPNDEDDYQYRWRDVREMRNWMRYTWRETRTKMNSEVRRLRDSVRAETFAIIDSMPHEIRIGWGDMMFENLIWQEKPYPTILPNDYTATYKENYHYTQHWFAEYLYNFGYWYSVGMQVDYSGVLWNNVTRNGQGKEIDRETKQSAHNIAVIPTVRFSYFHSEYVSLYSALGLGLNINTSTETDYKGRTTAFAPAVNISLLGMRVGKGRFFGSMEVGGMLSLMSSNEVYMLGSRIFTASVGCRL